MHLHNGYLFAWVMRLIFLNLEVPNGGFPSSHIALASSILISAYRYERGVFYALVAPFLALCASTVYVGEHYAVDSLAGLAVGPLFHYLAPYARTAIERWSADLRFAGLRKALSRSPTRSRPA